MFKRFQRITNLHRYVTWNNRIDFSEETKLSSTQEEERAWLAERRASSGDTSSAPDYPFICEVSPGTGLGIFLPSDLASICSSQVAGRKTNLTAMHVRLQHALGCVILS